MNINFKKKYGESKWVTMGEGETAPQFLIRPYPASREVIRGSADGGVKIDGEEQFRKFDYCFQDWKNVVDEETGQPAALTAEFKRDCFDHNILGIRNFITEEVAKLTNERANDQKN